MGRRLLTLRDAGNFIAKLPKSEHDAPEWRAATRALMLVAGAEAVVLQARPFGRCLQLGPGLT
jgi:hypothetical protein